MPLRRDLARALGALAALPGARAGAAGGDVPLLPFPLGTVGVVGTRHQPEARRVAALLPGAALDLRREPGNRHDPLAVAVHLPGGARLGYLPRHEARRLAGMMDAGGRIVAALEDAAVEATPGDWRLDLRLGLLTEAAPPAPGSAAQIDALLRAPSLLAERHTGPDYGARAVMLAGPCAGWQRTKAAEWMPPGALPLPSWAMVARHWRLVEGEGAAVQAAAIRERARELGLPVPGAGIEAPPPPEVPPRPPERPRVILEGWLSLPGRGPSGVAALRFLTLRREERFRGVQVLDRRDRPVAPLPPEAAEVAWRLLEEGYRLDIVAGEEGPRPAGGRLLLPYALRLRGDDPPDVARTRAELLRHIGAILPEAWDAETRFGGLPPGVLWRFVQHASPVAHQAGGRLPEAEAAEILAAASVEPGAAPPVRVRVLRGDPLASKRRGRGLPLPARLRLAAARLEAGLRETPQRLLPVAFHLEASAPPVRRAFLRFLVTEALAEIAAGLLCPSRATGLLARAREVLTGEGPGQDGRRAALAAEVDAAAPPLRRRRNVHSHGAVAEDRRTLLLRAVLAADQDGTAYLFWLAAAYAVADYDTDHFVMRGRHVAARMLALADWLESHEGQAVPPDPPSVLERSRLSPGH